MCYVLFLSLILIYKNPIKSPTCAVKNNFVSVAFIKDLSNGLSTMDEVDVNVKRTAPYSGWEACNLFKS